MVTLKEKILVNRQLYSALKVLPVITFLAPVLYFGMSDSKTEDRISNKTSTPAVIETTNNISILTEADILATLKSWMPGIKLSSDNIIHHERVGMYQFMIQDQVFYLNDTGTALLKGDLFDVAMIKHDPERSNLTKQFDRALAFARNQSEAYTTNTDATPVSAVNDATEAVAVLRSLPNQAVIDVPADGTEIGKLYVFFDLTCPNCKKFLPEIADLAKAGYRVRIVLVSKDGLTSRSAKHASQLACQPNAWSELGIYSKRGYQGFARECTADLKPNMDAAAALLVRGTPTIIRDSDGKLFEGLHYAHELIKQ